MSFEYVDNEGLSRGRQRPNAQALIDAGVRGVGADAPFGDAPFVQTWGRPQATDLRFFINAGWAVGENLEAYVQSNVTATEGRYRFFYRSGDNPQTEANEAHVTIRTLGIENALPQGFTPFFDGNHDDKSLVAGMKGVLGDGTTFDSERRGGGGLPRLLPQQHDQPGPRPWRQRPAPPDGFRRRRAQAA